MVKRPNRSDAILNVRLRIIGPHFPHLQQSQNYCHIPKIQGEFKKVVGFQTNV